MKETLIISLMLALSYHVSAQDRVGYNHDPAVGMFTQVDPLCEQYPHLNPYLYCAGNPVRYVDPDGRAWYQNKKQHFTHGMKEISKEKGGKYTNVG